MGVDRQLPPKREVALALLQGSMVSVYLDPRGEDVHVPPWFKKQAQLMLQIGLNMPVPIPDLDVGEEALSCTLSFNRRPEYCRIPWGSIYALVGQDGRGMIWPEDVPPEVAAQAEGRAATAKPSHLRAVPDATEERQAEPQPAAKKGGKGLEQKDGASGAAEKRKKKAAARAAQPARGEGRAASTRGGRETSPGAAKEGAASQGAASQQGGAEGTASKGKRELPSYLRVVK
jgi:stringent starvation protein B